MSIPLNRTKLVEDLERNLAQADNLFQEFGLEESGNADQNAKLQQLATHLLVLYLRIKLFPTRDVQQRNALPERVILLLANLTRCNIAVSFFRNNALMATTADCRSSSTPKTTNTYLRSSRVGV